MVLPGLDAREECLLAQLVASYGYKWQTISDCMVTHPLVSVQHRSRLNPDTCWECYRALLKRELDIDADQPIDATTKTKDLPSAKLANLLHARRIAELRDSIRTYEQRFTTLYGEIDELRKAEPV
ncbi:hypothetical protein E5Q_02720 [Mixia osmundae IAM 14324]|uniref:Myb-like domain-containing protein n=1 Tax=Mixia osmundae (strain CBS 9802 / IAM 14324 / JCM 22182 / KY 12970) TaxID=764103 RepID=G7DZP8_MIXOS|nr:hypothetical protein E5Q_02720 [Mixia osmundae IAM 14324]